MRKLCRVLFSRYAISALMILGEIALIVYLSLSASTSLYITLVIAGAVELCALLSLINRDTNPEYKLSWAIVILILPLIGTLLYLLFFKRRMSSRESRLLTHSINELSGRGVFDEDFDSLFVQDPLAAGKARSIMNDDRLCELYRGSSSRFFSSGEELFSDMIEELRLAKSYIFLEYFIISQGELWDEIHEILVEKARAGIDVRVLYDDIGCMKTLPHYYELTLRREGISAYRFSRVNPRVSSVHHNRDHRKICVIDGRVAYTGGVNIADEYVNKKERFGHWLDGGIRLDGEAVLGLVKLFLANYDLTTRTISDYEYFVASVSPTPDADDGYYLPFGSGPSPVYERPTGKNALLNLINQSEKYFYVTTPYLIIDYDLTEALCNAAGRGVDVRIITPGIADKKIVKIMTKSAYPYLIRAGVKIYEYTPGFIHAKNIVCDDKYAIVGTINLDFRSLVHHFEDAVWMYRSDTVPHVKDSFLSTVELSRQIDRAGARLSFIEWIFRNVIKLFSPLL